MTDPASSPRPERLLSLDFFRGATMFLLIAEFTHFFSNLHDPSLEGSWIYAFAEQFHHHPWNGLRFWDLIQPYFMFIVGVAMWYSVKSRKAKGQSQSQITVHILKRSVILLTLGVILHIGYNGRLVWELWNVLSQLSVTIPIAYFLMRYGWRVQLSVSISLLLLTELLYRFTGIPGFDQPFVMDQNFGSFMDTVLMGKINPGGGWVAINCIPTAAHTIWGVLVGKLLDSDKTPSRKVRILITAGVTGLVIGYGLDLAGVTPIIKRICTSSFVLASGGWCLITLAFFYWLIDLKKVSTWIFPFVVVGMNPIFIYIFMETAGKQWMAGFIKIFSNGVFGQTITAEVVNALLVLLAAWGLCYWLYRKRIFIKI